MSKGFFSKIGRALSIFGVSSPDDIRKMQPRKVPASTVKPAPAKASDGTADNSASQKKRTEDE
ncbi:MAG: hypothetical protein ACYCO5_06485 [Acidobacteriaceae bacterium]